MGNANHETGDIKPSTTYALGLPTTKWRRTGQYMALFPPLWTTNYCVREGASQQPRCAEICEQFPRCPRRHDRDICVYKSDCMKRRPSYNLAVAVWLQWQLLRICSPTCCSSYSWILRISCIAQNMCMTSLRGNTTPYDSPFMRRLVDPVGV